MSVADVDRALSAWRQGDVLLAVDIPFVCFAHAGTPLSEAARAEAAGAGQALLDVLTDEIGFVVLSQTCDVVRSAERRHYVELAPLVEVTSDDLVQVRGGRTNRLVQVPALVDRRLVADLDRVMVVEKPLLASLPAEARVAGCAGDADRRRFAEAVARRYARFAFPDDFNLGMRRVVAQVVSRHGKASPMGGFLAALRDLRAECSDWDAAEPEVVVLFAFETAEEIPADADHHIKALLDRFVPTGAFGRPGGQAVAYDTMTAARYRASDLLDFEYLSTGQDLD